MDESVQMRAVNAFNATHGEFYSSDTQAFYADGSYREKGHWGLMWDATKADRSRPDMEWQVQSNIVQFYRLKLQDAVTKFDELNTQLAFTIAADPDAELAKLQRLQVVVEQRRRELAQAEAALENTQWGRARRDAREAQEERRQRQEQFQQRRRAIRI